MRQWTVDAFASRAFRGNPACVLQPFDVWPSDETLQAVARENNQSETAYLRSTEDMSRFELRWFTPTTEVDLCGHATLAAAHVLFAELALDAETLSFETRSGVLTVRRQAQGYEMDFPADAPRRLASHAGLADALGVEPVEIWAGRYLVAVLDSESTVRSLTPDLAKLMRLNGDATESGQVIVCALDGSGKVDVVDRFFAPGCGIDEDPATGSAHCILGPLFAQKLGRADVSFWQAYPNRGASIRTVCSGSRVVVIGEAVTVMETQWRRDAFAMPE